MIDYSTGETGFLKSDAIYNIQSIFGSTLQASVIITDSDDQTLTSPYLLPPYLNPSTGIARLWNCCEKTISDINHSHRAERSQVTKRCDCGHEIASIAVQMIGGMKININIIQSIDENNHEQFLKSCTLLYHQSELFNTILQESVTSYKNKIDDDRRSAEEALIKAKNDAEESSRLKSSLLANMSHELRTPMTGILGFSEILHDELEESRLKNMASTIYKSANRLMSTLNSIMDLSAIESNRTNLNLRSVNVKNVFMALLRNAYNVANDKGLYIRTALPPNINVIADEKLLGQLLHHLVDNAIKFTVDGGISISTYSGLKDTADVVIKISDTGIGIAPQHHKLIFEEFRQVSEGLSRTFEGSGLGLSLVMKIAKLIKARVWVESVPEKGSDFYIALPSAGLASIEVPAVDEKPEPINTVRLGRGSVPEVLIVEDNEINRRLAALYLREICNIEMAENGYIAMTKIKAKKYDAILMDINLGAGPNGIHIAQEIRAMEHYKDVPIIAVTGYTMQGDREKLLSNGCTHYVAKPYDKQTLIKLFSGLLYKHPVAS
ncbi:MAG: hybrid sensor histidine kinase/response regulator [Chloroflexota bacterium]